MSRKNKVDSFKNLTWDDLEDWAGSRIVSRGQRYQEGRCVRELARTPDGALVAWIQGTERYATLVDFERNDLVSECTCPYGDTCKHAVALVLEYLHLLKQGEKIPEISPGDRRLSLLAGMEGEEEWGMEGEEDEREDVPSRSARIRETAEGDLPLFLQNQTKEQLLDLLKDLAGRFPEVAEELRDRHALEKGDVRELTAAIRRDIREIGSEPGWRNSWNEEGYIPDYSGVKQRLEALLAKGHADGVVSLGKLLLDTGIRQVEQSNDDGETGEEIASCMEVVFRALPFSSMTPVKQMLWAVDAGLKDGYDFCRGADIFWKTNQKKSDWNSLAEELLNRLKLPPSKAGEDDFSRKYRRDQLSNCIIEALDKAGRKEEIIPLCEQEAEITGSYPRLVKLLKESRRYKDAEVWVHKGIEATRGKWPGLAAELRSILREIREKEGDWLKVAASRAEDFFCDPRLETYRELQKAAEKAKVWPAVKTAAMAYLESGQDPEKTNSWPLPKSEAKTTHATRPRSFPATEALIDIAIAEKRFEDVIHWYDRREPRKAFWAGSAYREDHIASSIAERFPERAVGIWKKIAENEIALTKPSAYETGAVYLRKAQIWMQKMGKTAEWQQYLAGLRKINERKRRFVQILDRLEQRPILTAAKK